MKWYKVVLYVLLGILLLPFILLYLLFTLLVPAKKKQKSPPKKKASQVESLQENLPARFSMQYEEPAEPLPDEDFIRRIDEFVCLQYTTWNDYSGRSSKQELIAAECPELKERVLNFLQEHPVENLLYGERYADGHDMSHWELKFIFEDSRLNRCIAGYGITESTAPYRHGIFCHIPEISDEVAKWEITDQQNPLYWC